MKKQKIRKFNMNVWKGRIEMEDQPYWFQLVVIVLEMLFLITVMHMF